VTVPAQNAALDLVEAEGEHQRLLGYRGPATQPPDALPEGQPRPRGAYYTPDALALAICHSLAANGIEPKIGWTLEPGCGGGAFLRAFAALWPADVSHLYAVDSVPACSGPGDVDRRDLFGLEGPYQLILGNPDFGQAEAIVRHCLGLLAPHGHLAFLLRLNMLAGKARAKLYREQPLFLFQPIAGRPSFTGGGTDASDYGLFVWKQGHRGEGRILHPLEWR